MKFSLRRIIGLCRTVSHVRDLHMIPVDFHTEKNLKALITCEGWAGENANNLDALFALDSGIT